MNREFVMLGEDKPEKWKVKLNLSDYYCSEKLDGVRAIWIPWTRGMDFQSVPFANKFKDDRHYVCSGLWSRKMKPIMAPDWFVNVLPTQMIVDGELFIGRGLFQETVSAVRKLTPDNSEWEKVKYCLFDIPTIEEVYSFGKIRCDVKQYVTIYPNMCPIVGVNYKFASFESVVRQLDTIVRDINVDHLEAVAQALLPQQQSAAIVCLEQMLSEMFAMGGEGLMLRHRTRLWHPKRDNTLVKMVDRLESVGTVSSWNMGEGRLTGKMGSLSILWINPNSPERKEYFDLSGFTDAERMLDSDGKPMFFKLGQRVEFYYRELTDDGIPKQPRYKRPA